MLVIHCYVTLLMKLKFDLCQGLRWFSNKKRGQAKNTEARQELTEYKRKLLQTDADEKFININYEKEAAKTMYREGYYDANPKAKMHRGTMIMEDIIDEDFEKKWKMLNHPKN